jgi:hypothetical protein
MPLLPLFAVRAVREDLLDAPLADAPELAVRDALSPPERESLSTCGSEAADFCGANRVSVDLPALVEDLVCRALFSDALVHISTVSVLVYLLYQVST